MEYQGKRRTPTKSIEGARLEAATRASQCAAAEPYSSKTTPRYLKVGESRGGGYNFHFDADLDFGAIDPDTVALVSENSVATMRKRHYLMEAKFPPLHIQPCVRTSPAHARKHVRAPLRLCLDSATYTYSSGMMPSEETSIGDEEIILYKVTASAGHLQSGGLGPSARSAAQTPADDARESGKPLRTWRTHRQEGGACRACV